MKRRAAKLLLFLLLGAITNVAVAWGIALRVDRDPFASPPFKMMSAAQARKFWDAYCPNEWKISGNPLGSVEYAWGTSTTTVTAKLLSPTAVSDLALQGSTTDSSTQIDAQMRRDAGVHELAFGLPFRSMCWRVAGGKFADGSISRETGAYDIRNVGIYRSDTPTLPLLPIWPSFLINTIFYTAILWGLYAGCCFAIVEARRWRRVRKGLCPACAYPVGESSVCTECGKPVKKAVGS